MWKFLICIVLTCLYAAQKSENTASINGSYQKSTVAHSKSPSITVNADYAETKNTQKFIGNVDLDDLVAQKIIGNYKIKDLQNLWKVENIVSIGLLLSRLGVILIIFSFMWKATNSFTNRFVNSVVKSAHKSEKQTDVKALANTAGPIFNSILHWVLIGITLLIVLAEIGVDIMPIIYSFGVLGLAISIGAQTLVKDIISGILTLFEGIVSVGETVEINGNIGTIEGMSLRSIEFRHGKGTMQVIAFSEIASLINLSRDYSICSIAVPVSHEADIEKVEEIYSSVFNNLKNSSEWSDRIIGDINILGVSSIAETAIYIKAYMRTKPDPYDLFGHEFRKRLCLKMKKCKIPSPKFAKVMIDD